MTGPASRDVISDKTSSPAVHTGASGLNKPITSGNVTSSPGVHPGILPTVHTGASKPVVHTGASGSDKPIVTGETHTVRTEERVVPVPAVVHDASVLAWDQG
jgi:hypothetical protein